MTVAAEARIATAIRSPAGHACPFDETERRLVALLDRVPITRVYDATALDRLGVPVSGAVTPLAADLTVHAGKGITAQAAWISAVMEAIERVSAETVDAVRVRRDTFEALRAKTEDIVLDPDDCDLVHDSSYDPAAPCDWVAGEDVMSGERVWVALDLVLSPAREGICRGTDTNGLAAGNTYEEALLHALYEVIERDADAERRFRRTYGEGEERVGMRLLAHASLPPLAARWVSQVKAAGLFVEIEEITHDIGVPVFRAHLSDRAFPGHEATSMVFEGLGCDLDAANAVVRALGEAAQAHTTVLLGARDHFEGGERAPLSPARLLAALMTPSCRVDFEPTEPPPDLRARLGLVLGRLNSAGLRRCIVVDLTRADLNVPALRVLVPGACGPNPARRPPLRLLRHLV